MGQLREHYERQDTEELLEYAKKDLTEEARTVLESVLEARGVDPQVVQKSLVKAASERDAAALEQSRLAPIPARAVALAIDIAVGSIVVFVALLPVRLFSEQAYSVATILLWWTYFLLKDAIPGQSPGKRMLGLRVVQVNGDKKCRWGQSIWRNLWHGFFWIDTLFALGKRQMRLGDMTAGTRVIRSATRSAA